MSDGKVVEKILHTLIYNFDYNVCAKQSRNINTLQIPKSYGGSIPMRNQKIDNFFINGIKTNDTYRLNCLRYLK